MTTSTLPLYGHEIQRDATIKVVAIENFAGDAR